MTGRARGVVLLALVARVAGAQASGAAPAAPDAAVRALVAAKWGLAPAEVVLRAEGALPAAADPSRLVLVGSGEGDAPLLVVDRAAPPGTPPVRLHAGRRQRVVLATRAIARGDTLTAPDLAPRDTILWGRPRPQETVTAQPGWIARRAIAVGEPLLEPAVGPAPAVTVGHPVQYRYADAGIALALRGIAANTARLGERVTVRIDARRRLDGIAVAPGVVALR